MRVENDTDSIVPGRGSLVYAVVYVAKKKGHVECLCMLVIIDYR